MTDNESIYQLKVLVRGSKPLIWRRIQTPDITLARLHSILQAITGWSGSFKHAFYSRGVYFVDREQVKATVFMLPPPPPPVDEAKVTLSRLALEEGEWFLYEYGPWRLWSIFEKVQLSDPDVHYPICLKGRRACPPEQLSGLRGLRDVRSARALLKNIMLTHEQERREGYYEFVEAMQNPRHPDHKVWVTWHGGKFDPEAFDLEAVNKALKKLR